MQGAEAPAPPRRRVTKGGGRLPLQGPARVPGACGPSSPQSTCRDRAGDPGALNFQSAGGPVISPLSDVSLFPLLTKTCYGRGALLVSARWAGGLWKQRLRENPTVTRVWKGEEAHAGPTQRARALSSEPRSMERMPLASERLTPCCFTFYLQVIFIMNIFNK